MDKRTEKKMPLSGHLREARNRLFVIVFIYIIFVVASYMFVDRIMNVMLLMGDGFSFVYLSPSELLMCYMKLALVMGLILVVPLISYEVWAFAAPGLAGNEKRYFMVCILAGLCFFFIGAFFSFRIIVPFTLNFLVNFNVSEMIKASISVDSYVSFITNLLLAFGVIFEMPVLSALLSIKGILKEKFLKKMRKYAIIVIFIIAAVITPPDVVSQLMVAGPMILLYEFSIIISRTLGKRYDAKTAAEMNELNKNGADF